MEAALKKNKRVKNKATWQQRGIGGGEGGEGGGGWGKTMQGEMGTGKAGDGVRVFECTGMRG